MSEIRVKIFYNNINMVNTISKIYDLIDNKYKRVIFVNDNTYTHAIIINKTMNINKFLPRENILGLAFEPNAIMKYSQDKIFLKYLKERVGKYFIGVFSGSIGKLPPVFGRIFKVHYSFINHIGNKKIKEETNNKKKYPISIIASNKLFLPGHKYRHKLIKEILKTKINIHIYGRGISSWYKDERVKGDFISEEPYKDYYFTIAIENSNSDLYITEKYINPISYECVPIYLGASKIDRVFGDKCCIKLTGNLEKDMGIISKIYRKPNEYIISLDNVKRELLEGNGHLPEFLNNYWK